MALKLVKHRNNFTFTYIKKH